MVNREQDEVDEVVGWLGTRDFFKVCELAAVSAEDMELELGNLHELSHHITLRPEMYRKYEAFKSKISINIVFETY